MPLRRKPAALADYQAVLALDPSVEVGAQDAGVHALLFLRFTIALHLPRSIPSLPLLSVLLLADGPAEGSVAGPDSGKARMRPVMHTRAALPLNVSPAS